MAKVVKAVFRNLPAIKQVPLKYVNSLSVQTFRLVLASIFHIINLQKIEIELTFKCEVLYFRLKAFLC